MARRLLLLSNSTSYGQGYLDHAADEIEDFLGHVRRLLFVPFAVADQAAYGSRVRERFLRLGREVDRIPADPATARSVVEGAEAVFVGGGNTFRLLDLVRRYRLIEPLRGSVARGVPYIGSSAGTVIAAPTLQTTNDMPIVCPESFESLGLVPFHCNCHYQDPYPSSRHMGETREERLMEFHEENERPVVGLREGSWLRIEGDRAVLGGRPGARVFRRGLSPEEFPPGGDLSLLLHA